MEVFLHGGNGNHARDLKNRGVFDGFSSTIIEKGDNSVRAGNHILAVPIGITQNCIDSIIKSNGENEIVNLSGLMNGSGIPNIHCLFGEGSTADLNAVVTPEQNKISKIIENKLNSIGVKIYTLLPKDHDKKMAIIQALTHFTEIVL